MYKVQTQFLANFVAPHSFYNSSEVVQTFRVFLSNFDLEETPQVFNRIRVWRLARPLQNFDAVVLEPFGDHSGSVTGCSVLLEHYI